MAQPIKFVTDINLNRNQLKLAVLEKDITATIDAILTAAGQIGYDTTLLRSKIYDGTAVRTLLQSNDISTDTDFTVAGTSLADRTTIKALVDASVVGLFNLKGGYDAATNSPDLDTTPIVIKKGDAYFVTVAGTFFTEDLEVGDLIIAKIASPTLLTDWVRVQFNLLQATETVAGKIAIADTAEAKALTIDDKAITPLKLGQTKHVVAFTTTPNTPEVITHNLNSEDVDVSTFEGASAPYDRILMSVKITGVNTVTIESSVAVTGRVKVSLI